MHPNSGFSTSNPPAQPPETVSTKALNGSATRSARRATIKPPTLSKFINARSRTKPSDLCGIPVPPLHTLDHEPSRAMDAAVEKAGGIG